MKAFFQKRFSIQTLTVYTDYIFSGFIFCSIFALIIFSGHTVFKLLRDVFSHSQFINIIHNIAYIIVLLKAYKILTLYLKSHNLSIKYLVQISIIAPAIEVIFAAEAQPIWLNVLFAIYSITNLFIYIHYHKELQKLNDREM